jgi:hypothetical protein
MSKVEALEVEMSDLFFYPFDLILILVCEALGFLEVLLNVVSESLLHSI